MDYRAYSPISPYAGHTRTYSPVSRTYDSKKRKSSHMKSFNRILTGPYLKHIHIMAAIVLVVAVLLMHLRRSTYTESDDSKVATWSKTETGLRVQQSLWLLFVVLFVVFLTRLHMKKY